MFIIYFNVHFKGRQVVINMYVFSLNLKKIWRRSVLSFSRKTQILIPKNDVTEPKVRLLSNNQLKSC